MSSSMPTKTLIQTAIVVCGALVVVVFLLYAIYPSNIIGKVINYNQGKQEKAKNSPIGQTAVGKIDVIYSSFSVAGANRQSASVDTRLGKNNKDVVLETKSMLPVIPRLGKKNRRRGNRSAINANLLTSQQNVSMGRQHQSSISRRQSSRVNKNYVPLYKISPKSDFPGALAKVADNTKTVIISVVDDALKEFALNFYDGSVVKLHLTSHLFVCMDPESRDFLARHKIPCFFYDVPYDIVLLLNGSKVSADFGSHSYYIKTNMKTLIVLDALQRGFNVLLIDVDIVLFKNPFPYFQCSTCDLHISMDREMSNSGFVMAKSNRAAIQLYHRAWDYFMQYHRSHDQSYLNMALTQMQEEGSIVIQELPSEQFPCGYYYFQSDFRMFNNTPPCPECVLVHNNYIGSAAAKIYRFRENHLWTLDEDQYYSNGTQRFLTYENPLPGGMSDTLILETEMQALKNAMVLGTALNRVVVLPTFSCCDCTTMKCHHGRFRCSLLSVLRLKTFDEEYKGKYREHVFMTNKRVPAHIKRAKEVYIEVVSSTNGTYFSSTFLGSGSNGNSKLFVGRDNQSKDEKQKYRDHLLKWLEPFKGQTVLKFSSLPGNFRFIQSELESFYYDIHEQVSFQCSNYDQWEANVKIF